MSLSKGTLLEWREKPISIPAFAKWAAERVQCLRSETVGRTNKISIASRLGRRMIRLHYAGGGGGGGGGGVVSAVLEVCWS